MKVNCVLSCSVTILVFIAAGCGKKGQTERSNISVIGGEIIDSTQYPAVVQIRNEKSLCTATFIDQSTLITAAHCVLTKNSTHSDSSDSVSNVEIKLAKNLSIKSRAVFAHQNFKYSPTGRASIENSKSDVALVLLENYKSPHIVKITSQTPVVQDNVTLIGFGLPNAGVKQIGFNQIRQVAPGLLLSVFDQDTEELRSATIGPGDSGGPLFIKNKIAGIASAGTTLSSFHVDVTSDSVTEFLRRHLKDAIFE